MGFDGAAYETDDEEEARTLCEGLGEITDQEQLLEIFLHAHCDCLKAASMERITQPALLDRAREAVFEKVWRSLEPLSGWDKIVGHCESRPLLILADVSVGGMPLETMNATLEAFFKKTAGDPRPYSSYRVFVNLLTYSHDCNWASPSFVPLEEFHFQPLTQGGEAANLGGAFKELERQIRPGPEGSLWYTLPQPRGIPLVFLLSGGKSSDSWQEVIGALEKNSSWPVWEKYQFPMGTPGDGPIAHFARVERITTQVDGREVPDLLRLLDYGLEGPLTGMEIIPRSDRFDETKLLGRG